MRDELAPDFTKTIQTFNIGGIAARRGEHYTNKTAPGQMGANFAENKKRRLA